MKPTNNFISYKKRKNDEIKLIGNKRYIVDNADMQTLYKLKVPKNRKILSPTNVAKYASKLNLPGVTFSYNYMRYDSMIEIKDFANIAYNLPKECISKTFFTNSGMSAISVLLLTFIALGQKRISAKQDCYFETGRLFKLLKIKTKHSHILWLDTISNKMDFHEQLLRNRPDIVVIDTTCMVPSELSGFIQAVINSKKICILVRSHVKIDMLGSEYSMLGSLSFIWHKDKTPHRNLEFCQHLLLNCVELIGKIGAHVSITSIPPFWFNEQFGRILTERTKIIRLNNIFFSKECTKHNIKHILPEHALFVLIDSDTMNLAALKTKILQTNISKYCSFAGSFGFDFVTIDAYLDQNTGKNTIRIAISDYSNEIIKEVTKGIINALLS